ncbi:hypothetical protein F7725_010935 [Dissostichus mawsoni]|uniref:B box-type domain-containing protein n=1 Tax=Dissostichus mawsoni TaxID=36200 RepID=A0A7J5Z7E5_DISMA|nr:hypothetical protein F7725_010935 [Dissostichus mawsoni]
MSDKPLHVKASLDKEMYYHGETVKVNLSITNNTSKHIKSIVVSVDQISTVVLYSNDIWVKSVAIEEPGLFCLDHQQPVCVFCRDSEKHTNHRIRPIDEAAQDLREELQKSLQPFRRN